MPPKDNFIESAFKETDDLMSRFLGTIDDQYKNMTAPQEPKGKTTQSKEEALEKLRRGFQL